MKKFETVGNIQIYVMENAKNDITVSLYNGSDCIAEEVYFTSNTSAAVEDLIGKILDTYTEELLYINVNNLEKLTENTYKSSDKDYFCRIDNTKYFKHFHKSADDFIRDKNGNRIIDR
jgi:hypothetical protein|nr:MAG TPA: hypothetical protein [Bacteriophage sp.]